MKATVLVPVNGTPQSKVVLPIARQMAHLLEATIHLLHIGEPCPIAEMLERYGFSPSEIEGMVIAQESGDPAEAIVRRAAQWQSEMIIMCTHTATEHPKGHLGRVAEAVLHQSETPILFVQPERGKAPWQLKQVLFPHDGSPETTAALSPTVELAYRIGAELDILYAVGPEVRRPQEPGTYTGPYYVDQPAHELPIWTHEFLSRIRGMAHLPGKLRMHMFLERGKPGEAIVVFAKEHAIDLIVLAWHGQLAQNQAQTMNYVIRHAECPVLVRRVKS